jgi:hypothetical protein|tara:strand:+ start:2800 stop:3480 length:681 start_codon:yes stop_codon:yes gene_type:complete
MSDETTAPVEQAVDSEKENLKAEIEAMRKKNAELIDEYKKAKERSKAVPADVDVQALIDFKNNAEQVELEKQGKYTEARSKLEEQYRERSAEKDKKITELETKVRELELISPALQTLAEIVHDPSLVLNNFLPKDKIEVDNGVPVVVDGYERTPVNEWAKGKLPDYILKQPKPQGGGAPAGRSSGGEIPAGTKNPFAQETFNITEQMRLYRTDKDLYDRLKNAVKR